MAYDVFISHSSKDKQTADAVCHYLEQNGIRCWIAPRDILPGGDWAESIVEAIRESRLMLLIFSSNANDSHQINREVNLAADENIPIVPFRIENVQPSTKLRYYLGTPHWLDALTPPLEKHLDQLVKSISIFLAIPSKKKVEVPEHIFETDSTEVQTLWKNKSLWLVAGGIFIAFIISVVTFMSITDSSPTTNNESYTTNSERQKNVYSTSTNSGNLGVNTVSTKPQSSPLKKVSADTVTIEEFSDFQCPTCAAKATVFNEIKSIYRNRINYIYRNFPLTSIHPKAYDAAIAAEAAEMQGKLSDMQKLLYSNQNEWTNSANHFKLFEDYARRIGLNIEKFKEDLSGETAKSRVDEDLMRGRNLGVNATPSLYINGKSIPFQEMEVDRLRQLINAELQRSQSRN